MQSTWWMHAQHRRPPHTKLSLTHRSCRGNAVCASRMAFYTNFPHAHGNFSARCDCDEYKYCIFWIRFCETAQRCCIFGFRIVIGGIQRPRSSTTLTTNFWILFIAILYNSTKYIWAHARHAILEPNVLYRHAEIAVESRTHFHVLSRTCSNWFVSFRERKTQNKYHNTARVMPTYGESHIFDVTGYDMQGI